MQISQENAGITAFVCECSEFQASFFSVQREYVHDNLS